jgi:hypothetical protein
MIQIYALCCSYLAFDRHIFFPDRDLGTGMTIPVSSDLLIHPKSCVHTVSMPHWAKTIQATRFT